MGKRDQYTETCHKERYVTTWKSVKIKKREITIQKTLNLIVKRGGHIKNCQPMTDFIT